MLISQMPTAVAAGCRDVVWIQPPSSIPSVHMGIAHPGCVLHGAKLHRDHHTSILVPSQQCILATPHLRLFHIRPSPKEVLVCRNPRQPSSDRSVDILHDSKVRRKQDVEVALLHQRRPNKDSFSLVAGLDDGSVEARRRLRERVEVGGDEAMCRKAAREDVEEGH